MEAISVFIKVSLPNYLRNLPVPDSIGGFAQLKGSEWVTLAIFVVSVAIIFCALLKLVLQSLPQRPLHINQVVKKDSPKVVDVLEIEDLAQEKISYCRCWRSSKFPLCDGSHNAHNDETGDNVGPLVIRRKEKK